MNGPTTISPLPAREGLGLPAIALARPLSALPQAIAGRPQARRAGEGETIHSRKCQTRGVPLHSPGLTQD
jgi:hypothetical protein